ncbi:MAG TPA: tyrosine--tRNA ligase [Patescibacteria group bacterium]
MKKYAILTVNMDTIEELLTRGVANIIPGKEELRKKLESGEKLNIYLGIDPTATKIHLGHAVPLRKLQALAELGHNVNFLIGDFTALIGDTSDKDTERPVLTSEEIHENFQTYKRQAEKIIDFSKVKVVHNRDWLSKLSFEEIVKLCQHYSVGDFVGRELIRKRLQENKRVGLHELLYPVMQGYDSYFMDTDIQIGGTDQTFNMQAGRILQKDLRNKESFVLAMEFLIGTDGRKMSKSWGNAIWLEDGPEDMFGKIMAIEDSVIVEYFKLGTRVPMQKVYDVETRLNSGEHPMDIKKELAEEIVKEFHGEEAAKKAAENFKRTVQDKEIPDEIPVYNYKNFESLGSIKIIDLLEGSGFVESRSEAKRLVQDKGIKVNGRTIEKIAETIPAEDGLVVQIGKRRFFKVVSE